MCVFFNYLWVVLVSIIINWLLYVFFSIRNLSHNELRINDSRLFDHLDQLETLDLSYNYISVLEDNAFLGLTSLTAL